MYDIQGDLQRGFFSLNMGGGGGGGGVGVKKKKIKKIKKIKKKKKRGWGGGGGLFGRGEDGCRERRSTTPSCLNRMLRWNAHLTSALLVLAVAAMNV